MVQAPTANCVNHRRRPKVAGCGVCGNALCGDCIVHTAVGVKCRSCTGARSAGVFQAADAPSAPTPRSEKPSAARRRPWAAALVAGGLVVIAVAAFALLSRDTEPTPTETADAGLAADFTERSTEFAGAGGQNMGGTLTLPGAGTGREIPAVLIVPGLGAIDRDQAVAATTPDVVRDALVTTISGVGVSSGDPLYKDLAESLAKAGVASFRYDRRGTTVSPLRTGQKLTLDDEVADARAALNVLAQRQEIGGAPLVLIGHDTGGLVAMRLATANPRIKGVVAVSTPGRPLVDVMADELSRNRGAPLAEQFRAAVSSLTASGRPPAPETLPELLRPIFAPGHDAYLTALFSADPVPDAARVQVPMLFVRGGGDKSLIATDTDRLAGSLRTSAQVLVTNSQADHNLSLAGTVGHEHSNTVATGPVDHRDKDARTAVTAWIQTHLTS